MTMPKWAIETEAARAAKARHELASSALSLGRRDVGM
jgi:hypothetical protein